MLVSWSGYGPANSASTSWPSPRHSATLGPLAPALAILAASGLCTGYIATASGALFDVIPDEHRGKASGVVGAGMSLGQGVMMIAAGAAAVRVSPALVVAACGAAGTAAAVPLLLVWRRVQPAR